jgi:hypothetical protein
MAVVHGSFVIVGRVSEGLKVDYLYSLNTNCGHLLVSQRFKNSVIESNPNQRYHLSKQHLATFFFPL